MPPLITRDEALALGELQDPSEIEALVQRAWDARRERFGDATDLCSLVGPNCGVNATISPRPTRRCTR